MKKLLLSLALMGLAVLLFSTPHFFLPLPSSTVPSSRPSPALPLPKAIRYKSYTLAQSVVHALLIPAQRYAVTPALAPELDTLEGFAHKHRAIAALNGGFFDPANHKSTSYLVRQGNPMADPRLNERLMDNPDLAPYLEKILNRTEFRRYQCGQVSRYDIVPHSEPPPAGCQLSDALGGGPQILPEITSIAEGFLECANGEVIRDPLSSIQPNARTAVGITRDGSIVWVMVAQGEAAAGMSLPELAKFLKTLSVEKAMNLDGGSSSSLYYKGKTYHGKVDAAGNPLKRPLKSVLLVQVGDRKGH